MALTLYAGNNGYFDKVDRRKVVETEAALQSFARSSYGDLIKGINEKPDLSKEVEASLKKCCDEFFATLEDTAQKDTAKKDTAKKDTNGGR